MTTAARVQFVVIFEAMPSEIDGARRLALVLKYALRAGNLKCVRAVEASSKTEGPEEKSPNCG